MNDIYQFDSDEEKYFYAWLLECKQYGLVDWIYDKRKTYQVCCEVIKSRMNKKSESFILTKKREYTPDFIFKFNQSARGKLYHDSSFGYVNRPYFYCNNNRGIIYVDVKGGFNGRKSDMIFPDRQSLMSDRFNIYVQKVIPFILGSKNKDKSSLFVRTFTPQSMLDESIYTTSKVGKWNKGESKLKFKVTKIEDYVRTF